jgi:hypothetical protein
VAQITTRVGERCEPIQAAAKADGIYVDLQKHGQFFLKIKPLRLMQTFLRITVRAIVQLRPIASISRIGPSRRCPDPLRKRFKQRLSEYPRENCTDQSVKDRQQRFCHHCSE